MADSLHYFAPKFACCRGEYFYKSEHVFVGSKKGIYVVCFLLCYLSLMGIAKTNTANTGEKTL